MPQSTHDYLDFRLALHTHTIVDRGKKKKKKHRTQIYPPQASSQRQQQMGHMIAGHFCTHQDDSAAIGPPMPSKEKKLKITHPSERNEHEPW